MSNNSGKNVSQSPDKYEYMEKRTRSADSEEAIESLQNLLDIMRREDREKHSDPAWVESNLEYDLLTTDWILEKVRSSDIYAQNLYAALCNNDFQKNQVIDILKDQRWSCSWRHAGGIIADMQRTGCYMDWYCSGIKHLGETLDDELQEKIDQGQLTEEQIAWVEAAKQFASEGVVVDQIRDDFKVLGWLVVEDPDK